MGLTDDTFELELTAMAHGGRALGRHNKRTIFVPYTIPGEKISARITEDKGRIAFAEGVELMDASADRVFPECRHFGPGRCGNCHWQHIDYAAQLLLKQDVLADQLGRIGDFDDATIEAALQPTLASPQQWGYNHHMMWEITKGGFLGFPSIAPNTVTGIEECHILHPDLLELYHALDMDFGSAHRLRLQLGSDGEAMLILTMLEETAPELSIDLTMSVNILLPDNAPVNLIGETHSRYHIGGRTFRVTAGSFFRPHVAQLETLIAEVSKALDLTGDENVLDLYAGVGLFSAFIADQAELVTLVESYPPAVTDADENLTDIDNVDVVEGTVEDVLEAIAEAEEVAYQAAVLDPPPDGLSKETLDALGALEIPRLVYVSSDPALLARDGKRLARHGYQLIHAQPIDLAPQTYYIDTVAVFTR
jgi:23S rRNA (uracil1939-C5)-methyltransferase